MKVQINDMELASGEFLNIIDGNPKVLDAHIHSITLGETWVCDTKKLDMSEQSHRKLYALIKFGLSRIDNVILLQTSEFKRDGGTLSAFYGVTSRFTEDNYGKQVDEKAFEKFQEVVRDNFCLDFIGLEADSLTPGNVITS